MSGSALVRRHAGAASSEGCLLGLEPRPAAAVLHLGLALRGKLRRVSSGPGAEACRGGLTTGPGAAQQAQKGVFWAWRRCEASERMTLVLTLSFDTIGLGRRAKGAKSANSPEVPLGRCS